MGVSQNLTVTQKSRDFAGNFSKVRIRWISTQSGSSWNGYNRTAYYYVSVNGGAEKKYSVKYTLPRNTTNTILDTTIVVPHRADGTASVKSEHGWILTFQRELFKIPGSNVNVNSACDSADIFSDKYRNRIECNDQS